jgi:DNA uptake protein ComE-like DNA-binding protein
MKRIFFVFIAVLLSFLFFIPVQAKANDLGVININKASLRVLTNLPGVGPLTAAAIIERRKRRPYTSVVQVRRVRGIGIRKYRRMRSLITVRGPTTFKKPVSPTPSPCSVTTE